MVYPKEIWLTWLLGNRKLTTLRKLPMQSCLRKISRVWITLRFLVSAGNSAPLRYLLLVTLSTNLQLLKCWRVLHLDVILMSNLLRLWILESFRECCDMYVHAAVHAGSYHGVCARNQNQSDCSFGWAWSWPTEVRLLFLMTEADILCCHAQIYTYESV